MEGSFSKGDVIIGNDVWIGMEAMILSGVSIGNGSVVVSRSVVTKNIPPYVIVAGNHSLELLNLDLKIILLIGLKNKMMDCSLDKIKNNFHLIVSSDIGESVSNFCGDNYG